MYITGCRAHLCHLPGLGQVGHSPRGTSGHKKPKTEKVVWTRKDYCPPKRTATYERPFTQEGN